MDWVRVPAEIEFNTFWLMNRGRILCGK